VTDTIGWGDVDAEPRAPSRFRWRRWWAIPIALIALAVVVIRPYAERRWGDEAAAWLTHEWHRAAAYTAARDTLLQTASARASLGDHPNFQQLVRVADAELADDLAGLSTAIRHHRGWVSDVTAARRHAWLALAAAAHDYRAEASNYIVAGDQQLFVPDPVQANTANLLTTASAAVAKAGAAHHVRPAGPVHAQLPHALAIAQRFERLTDEPVDLRFAINDLGQITLWDLNTGHHQALPGVPGDEQSDPMTAIGNALLISTSVGPQYLVPLNGGPVRHLPETDVFIPATGDRLWRMHNGSVQLVDATLRPLSRTHRIPAPYSATAVPGSTAFDLTVLYGPQPGPQVSPANELWWPLTGRAVAVRSGVCGFYGEVNGRAIVDDCNSRIAVLDEAANRITKVPAPPGHVIQTNQPAPSPDGSTLAVSLLPDGPAGIDGQDVLLIDTKTLATRVITRGGEFEPVGWSRTGALLLVQRGDDNNPLGGFPPELAYWKPGMKSAAAIRVPFTGDGASLVTLP
jgi:hypothetical protein